MILNLTTVFREGGMFMWPISVLMIAGIVISIERYVKLKYIFPTCERNFMKRIQSFLVEDKFRTALKYCGEFGGAIMPAVIKSGITRALRDEKQIEKGIELSVLKLYPAVRKNLKYLVVIANVATLLGLLGTIYGLMESFSSVAIADPVEKQALLASGISIAMNTTAFGLVVAIVCMLAYGYLSSLSESIYDEVDEASVMLLDILDSRIYRGIEDIELHDLEDIKDRTVPSPSEKVITATKTS